MRLELLVTDDQSDYEFYLYVIELWDVLLFYTDEGSTFGGENIRDFVDELKQASLTQLRFEISSVLNFSKMVDFMARLAVGEKSAVYDRLALEATDRLDFDDSIVDGFYKWVETYFAMVKEMMTPRQWEAFAAEMKWGQKE